MTQTQGSYQFSTFSIIYGLENASGDSSVCHAGVHPANRVRTGSFAMDHAQNRKKNSGHPLAGFVKWIHGSSVWDTIQSCVPPRNHSPSSGRLWLYSRFTAQRAGLINLVLPRCLRPFHCTALGEIRKGLGNPGEIKSFQRREIPRLGLD